MATVYPALAEFVELLQKNTNEYFAKHYPRLVAPTFTANMGKKYFRIVTDTGRYDYRGAIQRSVHCFVDLQGNVYKAAGWAAPAKGVRYNLFNADDMLNLRTVAAHHSSYLYK